jgi:hypothetical protein
MMAAVLRPRMFARLLSSDALNISRDPMLIFAIIMSIAPAIGLALGRGALDELTLSTFGFRDMSRYVAMVVLVLPAILIGWVTGFLLLEDRDDGVLVAVDVTPIGKTGFLLYRATVTAIVAAVITAGAVRLVAPLLGPAAGVLVVLCVAVEAVLAAVLLPAVARNKVEGLALTKLTNIASVVPLVALIPSPLRYVAGFIPTYWVGEMLNPGSPLPLSVIAIAALLTHAGWLVLLIGLFSRRLG